MNATSKMFYQNPKHKKNKDKNLRKGGETSMAKKTSADKPKKKSRAKRVFSAMKSKGFNVMKHILVPSAAVLTGIMATRLFKKHVVSRIPNLKPALQTVIAAGAVGATFYFLRKYVGYPSMFIAGAAALPVIDYLTLNYPDFFLAADELPALPNGEMLVNGDSPELILSGVDVSASHLA